MANVKFTELPEDATPSTDDLVPIVDDPGGSPVTKKSTLANLLTAALTAIRALTPAANKIPYYTSGSAGGLLTLDTDGALAANSDVTLASQKAIKTYADTKVAKALFDANTILAANSDDTPAALTVTEQTVVGRLTGGNIKPLSVAELQALIPPAEKTPVNAVAAAGTVTVTGTPVADEHLTVGGQEFHFKALRSGAGEITIDADNTTQAENIVAAITADLATVTATNLAGVVTVVAATKGVAGNALALTTDATGVAVSGSGALAGGIDGTVGYANEICADASYFYHAVAANTIADANWRRIALGAAY